MILIIIMKTCLAQLWPVKTAKHCTIIHYILTENEIEKKITHTGNIKIQHHQTIPVSPSDTSTGNLHQHAIKSHAHSIRKTNKQTAQIVIGETNLRQLKVAAALGWGCSTVVRASDRHAADAGSIPWCGKGFFSQSRLSVQTLSRCPYSPREQSHAYIC